MQSLTRNVFSKVFTKNGLSYFVFASNFNKVSLFDKTITSFRYKPHDRETIFSRREYCFTNNTV